MALRAPAKAIRWMQGPDQTAPRFTQLRWRDVSELDEQARLAALSQNESIVARLQSSRLSSADGTPAACPIGLTAKADLFWDGVK